MKQFKIIPLSEENADRIRKTKKDDFGHDADERIATGKGSCRVSLKPFKVGEDTRLLISQSPFSIDNIFNQPGPIFIHKEKVESYKDIHHFSPEIKADKGHFHLTLIGYNEKQLMILAKLVGEQDVDELILKIFNENPKLVYLHARSAEACCFIFRIERA